MTERPLSVRSNIVQGLYTDSESVSEDTHLITLSNILYVIMFGVWLAFFYLLMAAVMFVTVIGRNYGK